MNTLGLTINKKRLWLFVTVFWVFIYISNYFQDITATILEGYKNNYVFTMWYESGWLLWIPLTFVVIKISNANPIHRNAPAKSFFKHLLFAFGIAAIYFLFDALLMLVVINQLYPERNIHTYLPYLLLTFHIPILIYFLIVSVHQGLNYLDKFQKAINDKVSLESKLVQAQNQALKMQIRPHFLFNTHHSIISLLYADRKDEAIKMLTGLSDLLRKTLDQPGKDLVTVDDELRLAKLYLGIQEIRFKDRLKIRYDISPQVYNYKIPPFTLQPIIENAIIHGIEPYSDSGNLAIMIEKKDHHLRIEIYDDGIGIGRTPVKEGVGLKNIRSRLENIYEKDFSLEIKKHPEKGTVVTIQLPVNADKN